MVRDPLDDILNDCLERLQRGETVTACLARYPDWATYLQPLLQASVSAMAVAPRPGASFRTASRLRFLGAVHARLAARRGGGGPRDIFPTWARAWAGAAAALVLALGLGGGTVFASSGAMPDSPLYPIKRASERVQIALTGAESARARLHLRGADRRAMEMAALAQAGDGRRLEGLERDLVRELDLAHAEAGTSSQTSRAEEDTVSASAEAAAPRVAPGAPSQQPRPETKGQPAPSSQALKAAGPPRQAYEAAELQAILEEMRRGGERNLAHLTLAQRQAPPEVREALARALLAAGPRYGGAEPQETADAGAALRVLLVRGVATYREGSLWVGGRRVELDPHAIIRGRPREGRLIVVGGLLRQDGSILGLQVEVRGKAKGGQGSLAVQGPMVRHPDGGFSVAGYRVLVAPGRDALQREIEPGHWVLVEGTLVAPGTVLAERVRSLNGAPVPFAEPED